MTPFLTSQIIVGAVCLTIALLHMAIGLRGHQARINLLFALVALASAADALLAARMYAAGSAPTFFSAFKWDLMLQASFGLALVWFVKSFAGLESRWPGLAVSGIFTVLIIVNLRSSYGIHVDSLREIQELFLPWGESLMVRAGAKDPWQWIGDAFGLSCLAYCIGACVCLWRQGKQGRARDLGLSLAPLVLVAIPHGILVDHGVFKSPYLYSFSFLGLVGLMSFRLVSEAVRSVKLAEEIEAGEHRWQSLMENVALLVVGIDQDGYVSYVNHHFCMVSGYNAPDVLGKPVVQVLPPDERDDFLRRYQAAMQGELAPKRERQLLTKSGQRRRIVWFNMLVHGKDARLSGVLSIGEDVTDLRRAEQELRDEKERTDTILSTLNTGLVLIDRDYTVIWANAMLLKMFPDCIGKKCHAVAENRTTPCEGCQSVQSFADGEIHEREFQNKLNGRWYHVLALPVKDESGKVISVLEATTDIHENWQIREALRASEEKFREFFRNSPDYCYIVSLDGSIQDVNNAAQELLGCGKDELTGKPLSSIYAPESQAKMKEFLLRWQESGQIRNEEMVVVAKGDEKRFVLLNAGSIRDERGRVTHSTLVHTDITVLKLAQMDRDAAIQELEAVKSKLEEENIYLQEEVRSTQGFSEIVGESNELLYVLSRVKEVAETDATVLIHGETGVGKELVARAIHQASQRSDKPFVTVNCAALPAGLVESELFGYEPGAFTGASRLRRGKFEMANRGTLLLDEIGELSLETQAKLLRVLQEKQLERLGGSDTVSIDTRVIATTNRNLKEGVGSGRFRADLFYRLNVFPITVPPLRNRRDDIPLLVRHFVAMHALVKGKHIDQIPSLIMESLIAYDWPGNVRELKNIIERAVIITSDNVLRLPPGIKEELNGLVAEPSGADDDLCSLHEQQRRYIIKVLEKTQWRIEGKNGAAEILQIKPSTLRSRLGKLGIQKYGDRRSG